jgi:Family of unknown function (DUF5906)
MPKKQRPFQSVREQIPELDAYLRRIGAEERNFKRFVVREYTSGTRYYTDKADVYIQEDLTLRSSLPEYDPTPAERKAIEAALKTISFPRVVAAMLRAAEKRAEELNQHRDGEDVYLFQDRRTKLITMIEHKYWDEKRGRQYVPHTFWGDGEWRKMAPDLLPFWKPIGARRPSGLKMIHEGAKTAKFITERLADRGWDHPWAEVLRKYEHWGMIGGALNPGKTDYAELRHEQPGSVVYVCDRDFEGESVLQQFSENYGGAMRGIMFRETFPPAWDMAVGLPASMFSATGRYEGRPLEAFLVPATWATEKIFTGLKGKPAMRATPAFLKEWVHSVTPDVYIHRDWPDRMYGMKEFNDFMQPFSKTDDLARLIKASAAVKSVKLTYDPSRPPGIQEGERGSEFNTYVRSGVLPVRADVTKWEEYLEYLVTDPDDRYQLKRWCATFLARPEVKMKYGVLAISETQGTGKSTLGSRILGAIVGGGNFSTPSESMVVESQFNSWLARKRLAVIDEIYAGHNIKAYMKLMTVIADPDIEVNEKHVPAYTMKNWIHIYACSNNLQALKLDNADRRWFLPRITEELRPESYWDEFYDWLERGGGLSAILWWAGDFLTKNKAVGKAERCPPSKRKQEVIENLYSAGLDLVATTLDDIREALSSEMQEDVDRVKDWESRGMVKNGRVVILDRDLVRLIIDVVHKGDATKLLEKPVSVRRLARSLKWLIGDLPVTHSQWGTASRKGRVITNDPDLAKVDPTAMLRLGVQPFDLSPWRMV